MNGLPDFKFQKYGKSYQPRLESAADLARLHTLDERYWVATSAPIFQLRCDPVLLLRLDKEGNGRIKSDDLKDAQRWLFRVLVDYSGIDAKSDSLRVDFFNTEDPDGRALYETARLILRNLGRSGDPNLDLDQVRQRKEILAHGERNGDGVIPPSSIDDEQLRAFAADVMDVMGSVPDASGKEGVDGEKLKGFVASLKALDEWEEDREGEGLFPLGDATPEGYGLLESLRGKLDDWFTQCRVVALDDMLGRKREAGESPVAVDTPSDEARAYMEGQPIAPPRAEGVLDLTGPLNPAYKVRLLELNNRVIAPLLRGDTDGQQLSESDWEKVKAAFAGYENWLESKPEGNIEELGPTKLQQYRDGDFASRLKDMIQADLAAGPEVAALDDLEYVILLQRWMLDLCNNFVSFRYLLDPKHRSMFDTGWSVIDGRVFDLNLRVNNVDTHSAYAQRSGIFLLYSEITGELADEKFHVVTPVTAGYIGRLYPEKRGVLFDLEDRQWDLRVIKVVEAPVSMREAIIAPFKRVGNLITSAVEKITTGAEKQIETQITQATTSVQSSVATGGTTATAATPEAVPATAPAQAPAAPPSAANRSGGLLFGGSVAIAALSSSFAYVTKTVAGLETWHIVAAFTFLALIVLVPTILLAWLKLRRRNLGAVLEASGWAINAEMRVSGVLGRAYSPATLKPSKLNTTKIMVSRTIQRPRERGVR